MMNTTLKRADNRVEGCGVRKIIIIIRDVKTKLKVAPTPRVQFFLFETWL